MINPGERVRQAVNEDREHEAAGIAAVARHEHELEVAQAGRASERERAQVEFAAAQSHAIEAHQAAARAAQAIGRAHQSAQNLLGQHERDHAHRRDIAEAELERLLERVHADVAETANRFARSLCGPGRKPTVSEALALAEYARQAAELDQTAAALRAAVADAAGRGVLSKVTNSQYVAMRSAANAELREIERQRQLAQAAGGRLGELLRGFDVGELADVDEPAAAVIAANDAAQAALARLCAALQPTTNTTEAIA